MLHGSAVRRALELYYLPSQVPIARKAPLPHDVSSLLEIISGNGHEADLAAELAQRTAHEVREAAAFFVEQVLFAPESDSYRLLGATPEMSTGEIRRHMALLSKWVHPDVRTTSEHATFSERISRAWDDLKTEERRAAYDAKVRTQDSKSRWGQARHQSRRVVKSALPKIAMTSEMGAHVTKAMISPRPASRLGTLLSKLRSIISS